MSKKLYTNNSAISIPKVLCDAEYGGSALIKLIDYNTLFVTAAVKGALLDLLKNNSIPLLASPCMSNETVVSNKCAEIVEAYEKRDGIYARIIPKGEKSRIVRHMLTDSGRMVNSKLVGILTSEFPYLLKTVSYIRLCNTI